MVEGATVSGYILNQMVQTLRERGENPETILAADIDESKLVDPDTRVPLDIAWANWEQAYELCDESQLGLTIASQVGKGYPMLRYSLQNASTLGAAFERWGRFYGLISDHGTQALLRSNGDASMRCSRQVDPRTPIVIEDWMVGQWLTLGRLLVGVDWSPIDVKFEHASPGENCDYEDWFGAPVQFGADFAEMVIPVSALELPIRGSDSSLSAVLDRHIQEVLLTQSNRVSFSAKTRAAMAKQLDDGNPSASSVASSLHVSERTLLRRLRDEGTTPTEVLRQLRLELAEKYLKDLEISLTEIAYLLGYSELSAFHRAFKRWTGVTPAVFREQIAQI